MWSIFTDGLTKIIPVLANNTYLFFSFCFQKSTDVGVGLACKIATFLIGQCFTQYHVHSIQYLNQCLTLSQITVDNNILASDSLPFTIAQCQIGEFGISYDKRLNIVAKNVQLTIDVTTLPEVVDDVEGKQENQCPPNSEDDNINGTDFLHDMDDGKQLLIKHIDEMLRNVSLSIENISITVKSSIHMLNESTHEYLITVSRINNKHNPMTQWHWNIQNTTLHVCPKTLQSARNIDIPHLSIKFKGDNIFFKFQETVRAGFCGDSNFLLSVLLQNILENNRILCFKRLQREAIVQEQHWKNKDVVSEMAEILNDTMSNHSVVQETKRTIVTSFDKFVLKDLNVLVDFYRGSDVQGSRIVDEGFTIKLTGVDVEYKTCMETLSINVEKVQTTVGYIDDPVHVQMSNDNGFWDVNVSIPSVYIRTRQAIVDTMIVLFTFNVVWNEYDMLYNNAETIKFKNFIVDDINIRFKYYNSPVDYRKILKGNWKHLMKLVPHCDLSITFPSVILKYQVGWEDVIDAYLKELITTQRLRCVRKVVVGTAKRKLKGLVQNKIGL